MKDWTEGIGMKVNGGMGNGGIGCRTRNGGEEWGEEGDIGETDKG